MHSWKTLCYLVVAAVALVVSDGTPSAQDDDDQVQWQIYKETHKKIYTDADQDAMRKAIYLKTDRLIKEHNAKRASWTMGHNQFSDMTAEERKRWLGGRNHIPYDASVKLANVTPSSLQRQPPASVDLSTSACMPKPRTQDACGSCWSFVAVTPVEYQHCVKTGTLLDLSEQQLLDCDSLEGGCAGGWAWRALVYLKTRAGQLATEQSYPYYSGITGASGARCQTDRSMARVSTGSMQIYQVPSGNAQAMVDALAAGKGPLGASIYSIENELPWLRDGVYETTKCGGLAKTETNHAVVIVGYGAQAVDGNEKPYWIVRNTWGTGWGVGSYGKVLRGVNLCNIESWTFYITL